MLDYGCGSGILAMLGKKLGLDSVDGVDIDEQAIASAHGNAERNHCEVHFFLPEDFKAARSTTRYDLVMANILSSPLKLMAPMLCGRVAGGGALVLSGVLARQADEVITSYAPFISLSVWAELDGWVALAGRRPD
jgi:ribosomal protein L11 methyltransferase